MPAIGFYFPNSMTKDDLNALRDRLNQIAATHGYTTTRGPNPGHGSLVQMLLAIDTGELALLLLPDEQIHYALQKLDLLHQDDPFYNAWSATVAQSLRDALQRTIETEQSEIDAYTDE